MRIRCLKCRNMRSEPRKTRIIIPVGSRKSGRSGVRVYKARFEACGLLCLAGLGHSQLSALRSQVSALRSQISALRSQISDLCSQLSDLRSLLSALRSQVSAQSSQISAQSSQISAQSPQIPDLSRSQLSDSDLSRSQI